MNTKQKKRPAKRRLIGKADTKRENGRRGRVTQSSRKKKAEIGRENAADAILS